MKVYLNFKLVCTMMNKKLLGVLVGGLVMLTGSAFATNSFLDFVADDERIAKESWLDYSSDQNIVTYLNKLGMTKFDKLNDFMPHKNITRAEVSKFFVNFAEKKGFANYEGNRNCSFKDIGAYKNSDLATYMVKACMLGLFNGHKGNFNPWGNLTYGEALAVTLRMIDKVKLPETWSHWALSSFNKAKDYNMNLKQLKWVTDSNTSMLNQPISRIDMGRLLEGADYKKNVVDKKAKEFVQSL